MKFLIVDDEKQWRYLISSWLTRMNIKFDIAENGFEAIRLLQLDGYTHVTIDLYMPQMSGLTLCRYIKGKFPVTVIVLTNHPDSAQLLEHEVRYKFQKPSSFEAFEHIIKKVIAA